MNLGKPKIHSYTNGWNVVKTYGAVFFFNFGGGIEGGTGCFFFFPFVVAAPGGGIDGGFGVAPVFGGAVPGGPGILLTSPEYNLLREIPGWGGAVLVLLAPGKSKKRRRSRDITEKNIMLVILLGLIVKIWLQKRH